MWPKRLECVLHFFVVFTLPMIEFGHAQISAPKIGISILKTACINPWNSFLVDNGGEFNNNEFISFCENFNMNIKMTAAESPWSNGLVERHNGIRQYCKKDDEWQTKLFSGNCCCLGYSSEELPEECVWIFF